MGVPMVYGIYPIDRVQFPVALSLLWALSALLGFNKEENTTHKFPYKCPFIYKCIHPSWNYQNEVMERRTWKRFEYKYIFSHYAPKKTNNTEQFQQLKKQHLTKIHMIYWSTTQPDSYTTKWRLKTRSIHCRSNSIYHDTIQEVNKG